MIDVLGIVKLHTIYNKQTINIIRILNMTYNRDLNNCIL